MARMNKCLFSLVIFIFLYSINSAVKADPLFFSGVQGRASEPGPMAGPIVFFDPDGITTIELLPGGSQFGFGMHITGTLPPGVTNTLIWDFTQTGGVPVPTEPRGGVIPISDRTTIISLSPTSVGGLFYVTGLYEGTVRIDLIGSDPDYIIPSGPRAGQVVDSYTFQFRIVPAGQTAIPEPTTMLLFGTGLAGVSMAVRKKRKVKKSEET